ncbi:hypothetical protein BCR32DRAFT_267938, partial [Anaeromyces robustus]
MIFINFILLIFLLFNKVKCENEVTVEVTAMAFIGIEEMYGELLDEFNKYSKENGLNIKAHLTLFTNDNSTVLLNGYESMIETLLKKKSKKFDIYFYDVIYTDRIGSYFIDLNEWMVKDYLDLFDEDVLHQISYKKDRLVGVPFSLDCEVLYSNMELLNKYNKRIPKTWDELIDTSKYIREEEKKINHTDFILYNGLFPDNEIGSCSIYEFIHSFRKSKDSPFPGIESQEAID